MIMSAAPVIAKLLSGREAQVRIAVECERSSAKPRGLGTLTLLFLSQEEILERVDHCPTLAGSGERAVHGLLTRRRANSMPGISYLVIMNFRQIVRRVEI